MLRRPDPPPVLTISIIAALLLVFCVGVNVTAEEKKAAAIRRVGDSPTGQLVVSPLLTTADPCEVRSDTGIIMRIDNWVTGEELYTSYLDPAVSCPDPYPFTVTEINMPMMFDAAGPIVVSVDVSEVDLSDPACPFPGLLIDSSSWYEVEVPGPGLYDIWVPLDSPVEVTGPFFAGFLISNALPLEMGAAVVTDLRRQPCVSYNIWDPDLGFLDLGTYIYDDGTNYFEWPGTLVLYARGTPGGSGGGTSEPPPQLAWVSPTANDDILYSPTELWVAETSRSSIISYVVFEYSGGGAFSEIGMVFDGSSAKRNGVDATVPGTGYSLPWDFSELTEGTYTLRATAVDDSGRTAVISRTLQIEPTPPMPTITSPNDWEWFCSAVDFIMSCPDEDVSFIELKAHAVPGAYHVNLATVDQSLLGDSDGDRFDGNPVVDGEFGDYYSGPAAAAIALRLWYERGYTAALTRGATTLNLLEVAESLSVSLQTRELGGTSDDLMVKGLSDYILANGNQLRVEYKRNPLYLDLRSRLQHFQQALILGLGGSPGVWLALDGFDDWSAGDNLYTVRVSDPITGVIQTTQFRNNNLAGELYYQESWHPVEIVVAVSAPDWNIDYLVTLGADFNKADGWVFTWQPPHLTEGDHFFIRSEAQDAQGHKGRDAILLKYSCLSQYAAGDYNDDGSTDAADLYYLIQYVTMGGVAPQGGAHRADANCDGYINLADIVYVLNYLYRSGSPPCN
jgi:hypothetical protein